jgi:hypothetical protein
MKRLIGRSALIGWSLFMLLGFTRAAHKGKLTAVEVIAGLGISAEVATQHLNILTHQPMCLNMCLNMHLNMCLNVARPIAIAIAIAIAISIFNDRHLRLQYHGLQFF